jgi:hypothetical protein
VQIIRLAEQQSIVSSCRSVKGGSESNTNF